MGWLVSILLAGLLAGVVGVGLVALYYVSATRRIAAKAERLVPPAGRFLDVDGNRIHYVDIGEGPPILFLHGLGAQLLQFRQHLFGELAGHRLIALDRPGSGYSVRARDGRPELTEQARLVARFIEAVGLDRPLLVAHSLGGAVALAVALEHRGAVRGLALLSPLTRFVWPPPPEFAALYVPSPLRRRLLAHTTAIPTALKLAPATLSFLFAPREPDPDFMIAGGGWLGLRPSHFEATVADYTALGVDLPRLQERYGEIAMPVGILFGTADAVLDHRVHGLGMQDRIAGLEVELVDNVGHMTHYGAVAQAAALIGGIAARSGTSGDFAAYLRKGDRVMEGEVKIAPELLHKGETGARKYSPQPVSSDEQDGISRGGTDTGDPKDRPPKAGHGLTEKVDEDPLSTGKSDGTDMPNRT